jgi:hypothetical protein
MSDMMESIEVGIVDDMDETEERVMLSGDHMLNLKASAEHRARLRVGFGQSDERRWC